MKKRFFALFLTLCLVLTAFPVSAFAAAPGLNNFQKTLVYQAGQYADVPSTNTFSENVKAAYEYNIMQGYGSTFGVSKNITRLASIIVACRLHCIYNNGANNITELYTGSTQEIYLQYARDHGIFCDFADVSQNATRAEFAVILSSALPNEALPEINTLAMYTLPDVTPSTPYYNDIYRLYRAGILNGSDKLGTFYPDSYITRGAACAIATRMCDKSLRKTVDLFAIGTEGGWLYIPGLSSKGLTISKTTTITCYLMTEENAYMNWYIDDGSVISPQWAENWRLVNWKDTTIPVIDLTITPLANGSTTMRIYTDEYPSLSLTIPVTVKGYTPPVQEVPLSAAYDVMTHFGDGIEYVNDAIEYMTSGLKYYQYDYDSSGRTAVSNMLICMKWAISEFTDAYNICSQYAGLSHIGGKLNQIISLLSVAYNYSSVTTSNYFNIIMKIYNADTFQDVSYLMESVLTDLAAFVE